MRSRRRLERLRREALSPQALLLGLVAAAGVVLRVITYRSTGGTPNADEAVPGLMTMHLLEGELGVFYWGQAYGGTQEVLLTAPLFLVAGSSWLALRLVPMALHAVAALLVWRVGRRTIGEPGAAVAGAVFWIWPPFTLFQLVHQQGFYASNVVYCALLLLLALRLVERPDARRAGLFGLVLGLAFWQTAQIVPVAAGIIAWTVWKCPRALRHLPVAVPLAVLGALPWLAWNLANDWQSLHQPDYGDPQRSLRLLASPALPMLVGLRAPLTAQLLLPAVVTYAAYVLLVVAFAYGAWRTRHRPASILYVTTAVFPLVYVLSPKTTYVLGSPRYIVVLSPLLVLLLAQAATTFRRGAAVLALSLAISVVTLDRMETWFRGEPAATTHVRGLGPRHVAQWVPRDLDPLVETLDGLGLRHVYADYWLAYRLTFDTGERILAAPNELPAVRWDGEQAVPVRHGYGRYPAYDRAVRDARYGFVVYRGTRDTHPAVPDLERFGYLPHPVGTFVVYAPPGGPRR